MDASRLLSIIIPTIDERESVTRTVETLMSDALLEILEILLIVCDRTSPQTVAACERLKCEYGARIRIIRQFLPHLGGAFRSGITESMGTHVVLMFSDLESDPALVSSFVSAETRSPGAIISASRWIRGAGFNRYGILKLVLNWGFQKVCAFVFKSHLTDFTYGFRLYPTAILKAFEWTETDHSFVLESLLRPILFHTPVKEVPAVWVRRGEGQRCFRFAQYARYIPVVWHLRSERHQNPARISKALAR